MVTVQDLIIKLEKLDPEIRVFVKGYEDGYEDVHLSEQVLDFVEDYHDEWYYGPHELLKECRGNNITNYKTVKGIVL